MKNLEIMKYAQSADKLVRMFITQSPTLQFDEQHIGFVEAHATLRKVCRKKYDANRLITRSSSQCILSPGTSYFIKMRRCSGIYVKCTRNTTENYMELSLLFYGPDRYKIREKFVQKVEDLLQPHDKIRMIQLNEYGKQSEVLVPPQSINNVILKPETKSTIVSGLLTWKKSVEWYKNNSLVHKIGILLYGDPGCGKSTIIRSIATMLDNATIIMPNINDIGESVRDIIEVRKNIDGVLIVVLEDFDMLFYNRADESLEIDMNSGSNSKKNNQNLAFQLLDGLYSTEDTIYIATTNHIDRLDPAMIRHGRFDIQEKIDGFDEPLTMKFLQHFGYDEKFFTEYIKDKFEYPIQPAKLQAFIMEYRSREMLQANMNRIKKNKEKIK